MARVGCPDPECVKATREANEEEVVRVVTSEEVGRWKWLREKRELEKNPDVIHCPLSFCQTPVPKPQTDVGEESGWTRLRTCHACGYSFCSFCKKTWCVRFSDITFLSLTIPRHGPISACPIDATETFVSEYLSLEEGSHQRSVIERQYGKANVLRLVAKYQEDKSNLEWFKSSTMACPGCNVHVEKSLGCNHVGCLEHPSTHSN